MNKKVVLTATDGVVGGPNEGFNEFLASLNPMETFTWFGDQATIGMHALTAVTLAYNLFSSLYRLFLELNDRGWDDGRRLARFVRLALGWIFN